MDLGSLSTDQLVFPHLGIDLTVKSTAFTIGGVGITWYGILITVGMLLAMFYCFSRMRSFGIDSDRAIDGVIGGVIGGIVGARTYYVAFHWDEYAGNWKDIINIRGGGLAIYGGIIGALLIGSIVCKCRKVRLMPMFDVASLGFLIGQCIGRWGNFFNHEAFGSNTNGLFGMSSGRIQAYITNKFTDGSVDPSQPVHPCFFYESMWCLLGFILLHIISKKWRKFDGQIFLMYVVWYGAGRFFIEGLRTDSLYFGTVRVSQMVALISVVAGLILLIIGFSRTKRMGTDYVLYCNSEESKALLAEADAREEAYQQKLADKKAKKDTAEDSPSPILMDDAKEETAEQAEAVEESIADTVEEIANDVLNGKTSETPAEAEEHTSTPAEENKEDKS